MKKSTIKVTAQLIKEEGEYTVYCPELDIYTQQKIKKRSLARRFNDK